MSAETVTASVAVGATGEIAMFSIVGAVPAATLVTEKSSK